MNYDVKAALRNTIGVDLRYTGSPSMIADFMCEGILYRYVY